MNKKDIKYYAVIAFILVITIVFEIMKPNPIDWRFTLESDKKEPYGTYVLFNTLEDLFPGKPVSVNKSTAYEYNKEKNSEQKNYIYITDNFNIDALDTEIIFDFLEDEFEEQREIGLARTITNTPAIYSNQMENTACL